MPFEAWSSIPCSIFRIRLTARNDRCRARSVPAPVPDGEKSLAKIAGHLAHPPRRPSAPARRARRPHKSRLLRPLRNERKTDCAAILGRAISWYASQGIVVERVLAENAKGLPLPHSARHLSRTRNRTLLHELIFALDETQGGSPDQNSASRVGPLKGHSVALARRRLTPFGPRAPRLPHRPHESRRSLGRQPRWSRTPARRVSRGG